MTFFHILGQHHHYTTAAYKYPQHTMTATRRSNKRGTTDSDDTAVASGFSSSVGEMSVTREKDLESPTDMTAATGQRADTAEKNRETDWSLHGLSEASSVPKMDSSNANDTTPLVAPDTSYYSSSSVLRPDRPDRHSYDEGPDYEALCAGCVAVACTVLSGGSLVYAAKLYMES